MFSKKIVNKKKKHKKKHNKKKTKQIFSFYLINKLKELLIFIKKNNNYIFSSYKVFIKNIFLNSIYFFKEIFFNYFSNFISVYNNRILYNKIHLKKKITL